MAHVCLGSVDDYLQSLLLRQGLRDTPGQMWMTELNRRFYQLRVTQLESIPEEESNKLC